MAAHFLLDSAQLGTLLLRNRASSIVPNARTTTYCGDSASARLSISEGTPISQQGLELYRLPPAGVLKRIAAVTYE